MSGVQHHRFTCAHALEDLAVLAHRLASLDRALLHAVLVTQYEGHRGALALDHGASRYAHALRFGCGLRLCLFQEADPHAHFRHDARVLHLQRHAHLHRGLAAVGGGDDGDHLAGNLPFGVGVERGFHRHLRLHAADEGLADLDFYLQRVHVDDGADAGTGEPTARRQRRDDFAGLRGLGSDHAGERRAHDVVVHAQIGDGQLVVGHLDVALCGVQLCTQAVTLGHRLVVLRARHQLLADQCLQAAGFSGACFCCASSPATWLRAACSCEAYRLRCASASIGSSVAITWPASTRMPSSIITSRTLPVILAETVAMRRATT